MISIRELAVSISESMGIYKYLMKIDSRIQMQKQNRAFQRYGIETVRRVAKASEMSGCQLFLAFGTLLGAYRDHGFIPYDFDIDFAILADEQVKSDSLLHAMKKMELVPVRQYYIKESGRVCEDKFSYRGVCVDVHYFYKNHIGGVCCELCLPHEYKPWRKANATDGFPSTVITCPETGLKKMNFMGTDIYVPEDTEGWLSVLYGDDFMIHKPDWGMEHHKKRANKMGERLYRRPLV